MNRGPLKEVDEVGIQYIFIWRETRKKARRREEGRDEKECNVNIDIYIIYSLHTQVLSVCFVNDETEDN